MHDDPNRPAWRNPNALPPRPRTRKERLRRWALIAGVVTGSLVLLVGALILVAVAVGASRVPPPLPLTPEAGPSGPVATFDPTVLANLMQSEQDLTPTAPIYVPTEVGGGPYTPTPAGVPGHSLRYLVTVDSNEHMLVTYLNAQGGTEQVNYEGNWDKFYENFPSGATAEITAEITDTNAASPSITCQIFLDHQLVRTSTGTSLVSCGGIVP